MTAIDTAMRTISLDELNAHAALQIRVDRKYLMTHDQLDELVAALPAATAVLTIDGQQEFRYKSLYYDTSTLDSYLDAAHGRKRRWKIRQRDYLDTATSWLEIKTQRGSRTVKNRVQVSAHDTWDTTHQGVIDQALGNCVVSPVSLHNLRPALTTFYRRTTLFDPGSTARLTIDRGLAWRDERDGSALRLNSIVTVETKSPGATPSNADRILWQMGIRPRRFSKYATGMALIDPELPSNRWHSTMNRISTHIQKRTPQI